MIRKDSAYQELQALADNSEYLVTGSYEEQTSGVGKEYAVDERFVLCYF